MFHILNSILLREIPPLYQVHKLVGRLARENSLIKALTYFGVLLTSSSAGLDILNHRFAGIKPNHPTTALNIQAFFGDGSGKLAMVSCTLTAQDAQGTNQAV